MTSRLRLVAKALEQREIFEVEGIGVRIGRPPPTRFWGLEHHREVTESGVADQTPEWLCTEVAVTDAIMSVDPASKGFL